MGYGGRVGSNDPRIRTGLKMASTYLFVPGNSERKVQKALTSGSDAVIVDLEDSVPDHEKVAAREAVVRLLGQYDSPLSTQLWVRVNAAGSKEFELDVKAIPWDRVYGVVLPKAEDPDAVRLLAEAGARRVLLLVESVVGLARLAHLAAAAPVVERAAIGTWDLATDLGLLALDDPDESELIWYLRGQVVVESRRLGLRPPIDGIYANFQDDEGLRVVCGRAVRMGFAGKLLIHPRQVPVARAVFAPDPEKLAFAREVVTAYEEAAREGRGAVQVRGRAVDRPMVERARALLARWEEVEL